MEFKTLFKTFLLTWFCLSSLGCLDSSTLGGNASSSATFVGCTSGKGVTNSSIQIGFQFPPGYDRVVISRDGVEISQSQSSSVTSFIDTGLVEGMTYRYTCDAYIGARKTAGATYLDLSPVNTNAPTFSGIANAQVVDAHTVAVTWTPEATTGAKASYFQLFATAGGNVVWSSSLKKTVPSDGVFSANITGLGDELPYSFGVRACTQGGICDTNTVMKTVTTPDGGAVVSEGITSVKAANMTAYLTAPWKDSDGAISERRIYVCTGAACVFPATASKVYAVNAASIASPPTDLTIENLSENTIYYFKIVDVDPSGNLNSSTQSVTMTTGDLTAPLFGGITNAAVVDPKDKTVGLSFIALAREGIDVAVGDASGTTDYLLYQTSAVFPGVPGDACSLATPSVVLSASNFHAGVATYNVTNLTPRTNYSFCLRARDAAGNISSNNTSSAVTTWDITAPVFGGVQAVTFDASTKLLNVSWNGSNSPDLRKYVVKMWKNTAAPTAAQVVSFVVTSTSATSQTYSASDFPFVGNDVVYAIVDACDNAADLGLGIPDNCTSNALSFAKFVSIPDITPPQNFRGIVSSSGLSSTVEGRALIAWLAPISGYDADYQGFKIYSVDPSTTALTLLTTCSCATPGHCSTSVTQDNQCTVSGLLPGRVYRFHVRAYDASGNLTTYLDPSVNYADLRIKDSTAPTFISNLTVSALNFSWNAATDNQYGGSDVLNNPANSIFYKIYRKASTTFTTATNPSADGTLVATQSGTSFTDTTLTIAGTYYYTVCAVDSQSNAACDGVVKSVSLTDVVPPSIGSFTSNKSKTDTLRKIWTLNWSVSDNVSSAANIRVRIYKKSGSVNVLATTSDTKIFDGYGSTTSLASLTGDTNVNTNIDYMLWVQDEAGNVTTAHYRIISNNVVKATSITSNTAVVGTSPTIVINGTGFITSYDSGSTMTSVTIGASGVCSNFNIVASDYLYCNLPAITTPGTYTVTITNPDGSTDTSQTITYIASGTGTGTCLDSALTGSTPSGSGSSSNPYLICNTTQLNYIFASAAWSSGAYIKLGNNIDIGGGTKVPSSAFYGNFDGQGYALINNWINFTGSGYGLGVDLSIFKLKNTAGTTSTFKNIKLLRFNQTTGTLTGNGFAWGCSLCSVFPSVTSTLVLDQFVFIGTMTAPSIVDSGCGIVYAGLIGSVVGGTVQVKNNSDIRLTVTANTLCTTNKIGALIGYTGGGASVDVSNSTMTLTGTYTGNAAFTGPVAGYIDYSSITLSSVATNYKMSRTGTGGGMNGGFIGRIGQSSSVQISSSRTQFSSDDTSGYDGGFVGGISGSAISFVGQDSYALSNYSATPNRGLFVSSASSTGGTGSLFKLNRVWSDIYWAVGGGTANLTPSASGFDTMTGTGVIYNTDDIYGISAGSVPISGDLRANLQTPGSSNLFSTSGYDFTVGTGAWKWCSGITGYPKLQWEKCQ